MYLVTITMSDLRLDGIVLLHGASCKGSSLQIQSKRCVQRPLRTPVSWRSPSYVGGRTQCCPSQDVV